MYVCVYVCFCSVVGSPILCGTSGKYAAILSSNSQNSWKRSRYVAYLITSLLQHPTHLSLPTASRYHNYISHYILTSLAEATPLLLILHLVFHFPTRVSPYHILITIRSLRLSSNLLCISCSSSSCHLSCPQEMYRLTPSMVVSGVKMVYVPVMPSHKKRLTQS